MTARSAVRACGLTLAVLLALGACGSGSAPAGAVRSPEAASQNPPPTSEASITATGTPGAEPSPDAAGTQGAEPSSTAASSPEPAATPSPAPTERPVATPTPRPKPTPDATGGKVTLAKVGFAITLPKGWWNLDLDGGDLAELLAMLPAGSVGEDYEETLAELVAAGLSMLAFDTQKANLGANVSLTVIETEVPAALLHRTAEAALAAMDVTGVKLRDVTVDGVKAVRADFTMSQPIEGTATTFTGTQLYIPHDGRTLVVTIATPVGGQTADRDSLIKSIRLD